MPLSKKFQLPTLAPINISLTEGTNIPPPQDSPEELARPPTPGRGPLSSHPTTPRNGVFPSTDALNGANGSNGANGTNGPSPLQLSAVSHSDRLQRDSASPAPQSPSLSTKRPSSVRRFLGLRTMSSDSLRSNEPSKRPASPGTIDSRTGQSPPYNGSLTRKKSMSWFGRRRSSLLTSEIKESQEPAGKENERDPQHKGPPPPSIPEFKPIDTGMGADDMFRNIR